MPATLPMPTCRSKAFSIDEKGSVAIAFGLCVIPLMLATGLAIDGVRAMHASESLTESLDSAALAGARSLKLGATDAQVEAVSQEFFNTNMMGKGGQLAVVKSFSTSINHATDAVTVNAVAEVKTVFGGLAGVPTFTVPKSSVAVYNTKNLEVGVQLDLTGSMCQPCSKIAALKDAVAGTGGLLDILLPDGGTSNTVRVGLAPFTEGVNAGPYAAAVTGGHASADHCTYERVDTTLQPTDGAPTGTSRLKARSDLSSPGACPAGAEVSALSSDKTAMRAAVNSWGTYNGTAGHLGAAWAWYLVSPNWASIWGGTAPVAYDDHSTQKYVILMTDGIYNTVGGQSNGDYGSTAAQSQAYAQSTCNAMKAQGIVVYTIGFDAPAGAKTALTNCATDSSKFFDANDAQTLKDAFRAIAIQINNLRLSS